MTLYAHSQTDFDEYLPLRTLEWCKEFLASQGFPDPLDGRVANDASDRLHGLAYVALRDAARVHLNESRYPPLREVAVDEDEVFVPDPAVQACFRAAGQPIPGMNNQGSEDDEEGAALEYTVEGMLDAAAEEEV